MVAFLKEYIGIIVRAVGFVIAVSSFNVLVHEAGHNFFGLLLQPDYKPGITIWWFTDGYIAVIRAAPHSLTGTAYVFLTFGGILFSLIFMYILIIFRKGRGFWYRSAIVMIWFINFWYFNKGYYDQYGDTWLMSEKMDPFVFTLFYFLFNIYHLLTLILIYKLLKFDFDELKAKEKAENLANYRRYGII